MIRRALQVQRKQRVNYTKFTRSFTCNNFMETNKLSLELMPSIGNAKGMKLPAFVQQLVTAPCEHPHLSAYYPLSAQTTILKSMERYAKRLTSGKFACECASRLIIGEAGIGKSTALRSGVCELAVQYPKLVPLYIDYVPGSTPCLGAAMAGAMKMPNVNTESTSSCIDELERRDQHMFIVVDHLERLYTDRTHLQAKLDILHELLGLGSQPSGRVCVFVSSSVTVMGTLFDRNAVLDPVLASLYPMVAEAPYLKKKYSTVRLSTHTASKRDITQIAKLTCSGEFAEQGSSALYFFCGTNTGLCSEFFRTLMRNVDHAPRFLGNIWRKKVPMLPTADRALYDLVMDALVVKNQDLLAAFELDAYGVDWFALRPLSLCEMDTMHHRTSTGKVSLLRLVDFDLLSLSHLDDAAYVYPSSPLRLFQRYATTTQSHVMADAAQKLGNFVVAHALQKKPKKE